MRCDACVTGAAWLQCERGLVGNGLAGRLGHGTHGICALAREQDPGHLCQGVKVLDQSEDTYSCAAHCGVCATNAIILCSLTGELEIC